VASHHDVLRARFEHFRREYVLLIPSGMLLGAPLSVGQATIWNLIPVTSATWLPERCSLVCRFMRRIPRQAVLRSVKAEVLPAEQNETIKPPLQPAAGGLR